MKNPIKIDDLGVPLYLETPMLVFRGGKSIEKNSTPLDLRSEVSF